jgi:hypothetical protein
MIIWSRKGAHHGNFVIAGTQGTQVKGILGGITNAGANQTVNENTAGVKLDAASFWYMFIDLS